MMIKPTFTSALPYQTTLLPGGPGVVFDRDPSIASGGDGEQSIFTGLSAGSPSAIFASTPSGGGTGPSLHDRLGSIFNGVENRDQGIVMREISYQEILYVLKMIADEKFGGVRARVTTQEAKSDHYRLSNGVIVTGSELLVTAYAVLKKKSLRTYATQKARYDLYLHEKGYAKIDEYMRIAMVELDANMKPPSIKKGFYLADITKNDFSIIATNITIAHLSGDTTRFITPFGLKGKLFTYRTGDLTRAITGTQLLGMAATFALSKTITKPADLEENLKEFGEKNAGAYIFSLIGRPGTAILPLPAKRPVRHGILGRPPSGATTKKPRSTPAPDETSNPYEAFKTIISDSPAFSRIPAGVVKAAVTDSFALAGPIRDSIISTTMPRLLGHLIRGYRIERRLLVEVLREVEPYLSQMLISQIIDEVYVIRLALLSSNDFKMLKTIDLKAKIEVKDGWLGLPFGILLGMDQDEATGFTRMIANVGINGLIMQLFDNYLPESFDRSVIFSDVFANATDETE